MVINQVTNILLFIPSRQLILDAGWMDTVISVIMHFS